MKQFFKNIKFIRRIYILINRSFFFKPWPTKPLEFWIILNLILIKTKPDSILELGSGRSTYHLYEYVIKYKKKLESVEHNWTYFKIIKKGLSHIFGKNYDYINFVPIKHDWYDYSKISTKFDFLFIDGPNKNSFLKDNNSIRSSKKAIKFLNNKVNKCKIIIIDDTHKEDVINLVNNLEIKLQYSELKYYRTSKLRIYYQIKYKKFISNTLKQIFKETDSKVLKI